jgi:hypothetical protein
LQVQFSGAAAQEGTGTEGEQMVRKLQGTQEAVDEKLRRSQIQVFEGGVMLGAGDAEEEAGSDESDEEEEGEGSEGSEEAGDEDEDGSNEGGWVADVIMLMMLLSFLKSRQRQKRQKRQKQQQHKPKPGWCYGWF